MNKLKELKAKIIEAMPEIKKREILYRCNRVWVAWNAGTMTEEDFEKVDLSENISLEDVLKVLLEKDGCPITYKKAQEGDIGHDWENIMFKFRDINWQLGKNLDQQSTPTINFLHDLL